MPPLTWISWLSLAQNNNLVQFNHFLNTGHIHSQSWVWGNVVMLYQTLVPLQPPDILHLLLLQTCFEIICWFSNSFQLFERHAIGETLPIPSINAINPPLRGSTRFISMWSVTIYSDLPQIWIGRTSLKLILFPSSTVFLAASKHLAVGAFSYLLTTQLWKAISWRHSNLSIKAVQQQLSLI